MYILNELAGNTFMVFCSTCANTQRVALMLRNLGMTAIPLHGQMSQVCICELIFVIGVCYIELVIKVMSVYCFLNGSFLTGT